MNFGGVGWRHCSTQYRPRPFPTCHYLSPSWCIQSRVTSLVPGEERGGWSGERWVETWGRAKACEKVCLQRVVVEGRRTRNMLPGEDRTWKVGRETHIAHSQFASSLDPAQNRIPGLATADGPAHLPVPAWHLACSFSCLADFTGQKRGDSTMGRLDSYPISQEDSAFLGSLDACIHQRSHLLKSWLQ